VSYAAVCIMPLFNKVTLIRIVSKIYSNRGDLQ